MPLIVSALFSFLVSLFLSRSAMHLQILVLQHQVAVYKQTVRRPRLRTIDRVFWAWLSRLWPGWREALAFVQPHTVIMWQRTRFRDHWRRLSQSGKPGRPAIAKEIRELIRDMWRSTPTWGSPRIVGELRQLGIDVWKAFLKKHWHDLIALDFFIVPTVTCKVLFVLMILAHVCRRVVYFHITEHPTVQ
jgi:hypothetical protein